MKRLILIVIAILLVTTVAFAHGDEQHVMGTVTEVSEKSITVETIDKHKVTVSVVAETKFTAGTAAATLKDVKVGTRVVIHARNQDQHLQADTVRIGSASLASSNPHSQHPMPGMKMSEQKSKSVRSSMEHSMPGMDMAKQKPADHAAGHSMPGMDMGKPKSTPSPSDHSMPGMQMGAPGTQPQMAGMDHGGMNMGEPHSLSEAITQHGSSGTSVEPNSTPHAMVMSTRGNWMLMLHGVAFLTSNQQSGPRGRDKIFSTNWVMPMAQRELGSGTLTLRAMLSLEPATVTSRRYPELFQVGETAYGKPIVDGQHPHDLFMELAALYDLKLGSNSLISFYAAPVGDPALGPTAYPHRLSAGENPLATLGHHMQDSTHIADDVLTVGYAYKIARLEVSGFHGREPDEDRWDLDSGRIDSWATRFTVSPGQNWTAQYSIGKIKSPEELHPEQDVLRMTASVMYNRTLPHGNWANTLIWGRNRNSPGSEVFNSYLAESTWRFNMRNYFLGPALKTSTEPMSCCSARTRRRQDFKIIF